MMHKLFNRAVFCIAALSTLLFTAACDGATESSIPNVNFTLSYDVAQYPTITTPGWFVEIKKNVNHLPMGYAGIILGKSVFSEAGDNNYVAYDAACPVEANATVSVKLKNDGFGTATCPKCGTKYNLSNNAYPEGVGSEYLKSYPVIVNGTRLIVSN